ncbi:dynamin 2 [Pancytospora epiphaga]|nr:dynamin 2 [Pancytospora epiphaga]
MCYLQPHMLQQDKIRALQDILSTNCGTEFDLPKIAVLGSQSSGKSSVLEQILQKDFLPRGSNLVTRCPIIITLKKSESNNCTVDGTTVSFDNVPQKLLSSMATNCGTKKGIVDKPINLELCMPDTLDMVLIDLPGLTKIPQEDQPADIEEQVYQMAKKYISGSNTIILCIIPANTDIATTESLKVAKEMDPNYERTIGVLTKIDLMDDGTDCSEILDNSHPRLKYGYVGVINRSQADILNSTSIKAILDKEEKVFRDHPVYRKYGQAIGSRHLLKKLCEIFQRVFDRELPRILSHLVNAIDDRKRVLEKYERENNPRAFLEGYIATLSNYAGSNCSTSFQHEMINFLGRWCQKIQGQHYNLNMEDLDDFIGNTSYLLIPDRAFEQKVRAVSENIFSELLRMFNDDFVEFTGHIRDISHKGNQEAVDYLNTLVVGRLCAQNDCLIRDLKAQMDIQTSYINLSHQDFNKNEIISKMVYENVSSINRSWIAKDEDKSVFNYEFIKSITAALVYEYVAIVIRDIKDVGIKLVQSRIGHYILTVLSREILSLEGDPKLVIETEESLKTKNIIREDIKRLENAYSRLKY